MFQARAKYVYLRLYLRYISGQAARLRTSFRSFLVAYKKRTSPCADAARKSVAARETMRQNAQKKAPKFEIFIDTAARL